MMGRGIVVVVVSTDYASVWVSACAVADTD